MNSAKNNILWVDFVKVAAMFAVVFLHVAAPLLNHFNEIIRPYWWIGNIYDSAVRMCVPLFFMVSGYLLLGKTESLTTFFAKRIRKVLIPLVVWSIFYILWRIVYEKEALTLSLRLIFETFLTPTYYHLWFLYAIISVYLFVPILRLIVQNGGQQYLHYFIALWILAASVIPLFEKVTGVYRTYDSSLPYGYVGYLVIGYLLGQREFGKRALVATFFVAVVSVGATAVGTYFFTIQNGGNFDGYLYWYLTPNVLLLAISTFILLKHLAENFNFLRNETAVNVIKRLSVAGLGIYLIHPALLELLGRGDLGIELGAFSGNPLFWVPITAVVAFSLSFVVTIILKKIPIVEKCLP